ncbi:MAG: acetyl-CoA carboxylase, carboxyltransferase subunit beta [Oscillospiraceae bacterium]
MFIFKKPKNELELILRQGAKQVPSIPDAMYISCPSCKRSILSSEVTENMKVCPKCGHHFKISARQMISLISDDDSFVELFAELKTKNKLDFPNYDKKLLTAFMDTKEKEAVITGVCRLDGIDVAIFAMEAAFMMGSMGSVVGEKITRLFEYATKKRLPVIGYTVSGGARMQEGMFSLMQMAKTSGAVKRHSDNGLLYITILTNPTTGGVTASFAMSGDIILAEPKALICFAGPRVIEQTTRQKLPEGFQRAEFLLEKGFVDDIVPRKNQKAYLKKMLDFHCNCRGEI